MCGIGTIPPLLPGDNPRAFHGVGNRENLCFRSYLFPGMVGRNPRLSNWFSGLRNLAKGGFLFVTGKRVLFIGMHAIFASFREFHEKFFLYCQRVQTFVGVLSSQRQRPVGNHAGYATELVVVTGVFPCERISFHAGCTVALLHVRGGCQSLSSQTRSKAGLLCVKREGRKRNKEKKNERGDKDGTSPSALISLISSICLILF